MKARTIHQLEPRKLYLLFFHVRMTGGPGNTEELSAHHSQATFQPKYSATVPPRYSDAQLRH